MLNLKGTSTRLAFGRFVLNKLTDNFCGNRNTMKKIPMLLTVSFVLFGCATQPENTETSDRNNTAVGAVIGAVAGAVDQHFRLAGFHDGDDGVGRAQVNADGFRHSGFPCGEVFRSQGAAALIRNMAKPVPERRPEKPALFRWKRGF